MGVLRDYIVAHVHITLYADTTDNNCVHKIWLARTIPYISTTFQVNWKEAVNPPILLFYMYMLQSVYQECYHLTYFTANALTGS